MGCFKAILVIITFLSVVSCAVEDEVCINSWDCPENMWCNPETGLCEEKIIGDTGDTGNTGNSGNSGNSGDSGNSGNSGDSGNSGNSGDTGNSGDDSPLTDHDSPLTTDDDEATDYDTDMSDDSPLTDHDSPLADDDMSDDSPLTDEETSDEDTTEPVVVVSYTFEPGAEGWTHTKIDSATASWPYDMWAQGTATSGPNSCFEGTGCFGFNLTGNYINCQRAQLISPSIDLSSYTGSSLKIEFMHWYNFWASPTSYYDGGFVEFSSNGGTNWNQITGYTYPGTVKIKTSGGIGYSCDSATFYADKKPGFVQTSSGNWQKVEIDIPSGMITANFKIRYVFSSGVQKNTFSETPSDYSYPGWYIDNVTILKY